MAHKKKLSEVKRISSKLNDLLMGISQKNKMKFVEAGDIVVDIVNKKLQKRKVIENIRRELEF